MGAGETVRGDRDTAPARHRVRRSRLAAACGALLLVTALHQRGQ